MDYRVSAQAVHMGKSNAKAQAAYRARQVEAGARRLDLFISSAAATAIGQLARRSGVTHREAIERLVTSAALVASQKPTAEGDT